MYLPLKPIRQKKNIRRDGTSIIFIQYCFSSKKRTDLNTEIAIPPRFWNDEKLKVSPALPSEYGTPEDIGKQLKRLMRLAEDLIELGQNRKVDDMVAFTKEHFAPNFDLDELETKLNNQDAAKEALKSDVYHQIGEYIKSKIKKPQGMGLCWNIKYTKLGTNIWKDGGALGFRSYCTMIPDKQIGIIWLSNKSGLGEELGIMIDELLNTILKEK